MTSAAPQIPGGLDLFLKRYHIQSPFPLPLSDSLKTSLPTLDKNVVAMLDTPDAHSDIDYILEKFFIAMCITPLSSLVPSKYQRELDSKTVESVVEAMGEQPTKFMLSHPLTVICLDLTRIGTAQTQRKTDPIVIIDQEIAFEVVDGQHRIQAMKMWCDKRGVPDNFRIWPARVLHPGWMTSDLLRASSLLRENIMNHSNAVLAQKAMHILDQLRIEAETYMQSNNLRSGITIFIDCDANGKPREVANSTNVQIKTIVRWTVISNALVSSGLLKMTFWRQEKSLVGCSGEGVDGTSALKFLRDLVLLRIPEIAVPIIHASAELCKKLGEKNINLANLGQNQRRFLRTGSFRCIKVVDKAALENLKAIVTQVADQFGVPSIVYNPCLDLLSTDSNSELVTWTANLGLSQVIAISVGVGPIKTCFEKSVRNPNEPVDLEKTPIGLLRSKVATTCPDQWESRIIGYLSPDKIGHLWIPWSDLLAKMNPKTKSHKDIFANMPPEEMSKFCKLASNLLSTDQTWWEFIRDIGIIQPGMRLACSLGVSSESLCSMPLHSPVDAHKRAELDELDQRLHRLEKDTSTSLSNHGRNKSRLTAEQCALEEENRKAEEKLSQFEAEEQKLEEDARRMAQEKLEAEEEKREAENKAKRKAAELEALQVTQSKKRLSRQALVSTLEQNHRRISEIPITRGESNDNLQMRSEEQSQEMEELQERRRILAAQKHSQEPALPLSQIKLPLGVVMEDQPTVQASHLLNLSLLNSIDDLPQSLIRLVDLYLGLPATMKEAILNADYEQVFFQGIEKYARKRKRANCAHYSSTEDEEEPSSQETRVGRSAQKQKNSHPQQSILRPKSSNHPPPVIAQQGPNLNLFQNASDNGSDDEEEGGNEDGYGESDEKEDGSGDRSCEEEGGDEDAVQNSHVRYLQDAAVARVRDRQHEGGECWDVGVVPMDGVNVVRGIDDDGCVATNLLLSMRGHWRNQAARSIVHHAPTWINGDGGGRDAGVARSYTLLRHGDVARGTSSLHGRIGRRRRETTGGQTTEAVRCRRQRVAQENCCGKGREISGAKKGA
ncbi:hypothetical protein BDN70DRAFT_900047 [Pholiota conissans]|uniref:Uncharacterized protein n=1 Tax=Pholiota conissans TaxID=109636 RepID=A0A9P6CNP3_9AGAR|nr:hypothetical protein BDN70DRAFT_900047 [Pholiota conissans]